ncbi:MAG TPA: type II toxin-antitoxin system RelE/ParE family toxin [Thermodesulfobacteriota bacterium]|nr:type II toxin-antitoxin system RelE/ParE family toxin [Thermodesulfobacteriota bacterium]
MEPKKFNIVFAPSSQRDLERFETEAALQVVKDIKSYLETFPLGFRKTRIKKLTGFVPPLYRLRSGDFRAYYRIIEHKVIILAVTHKKDSERFLKKLK